MMYFSKIINIVALCVVTYRKKDILHLAFLHFEAEELAWFVTCSEHGPACIATMNFCKSLHANYYLIQLKNLSSAVDIKILTIIDLCSFSTRSY